MGAGGSTAVSCSSLDLSQRQHQRHYRRQPQPHQMLEQKMHRYRKQQQQQAKVANMKRHSNSYFDLASVGQPPEDWYNTNQSEAYSLSNANIGLARPLMVLPSKPAISPPYLLAGKSASGVASKIQQRQHQRSNSELRKISDSLPSLNNLVPYQLLAHKSSQLNKLYPVVQQERISNQLISANKLKQSTRQQINHLHNSNNAHLVNRSDEPSHSRHRHMRTSMAANDDSRPSRRNTGLECHMKRAISLSSLHNLHNQQQIPYVEHYNHHHHHKQQLNDGSFCQEQANKRLANVNQARMKVPMNHNALYKAQQAHNSNNKPPTNSHHLKQQPLQQVNYNQPAPLNKKILKFKQATSGQSKPMSKRYLSKPKQQQQLQQGCPVLPLIPRAQSLHELIRLRATENGQRMRTTGTLRGALNSDSSNKVNLVAELLESRRQQKLSEEQESGRDSSAMLSPASSSDDGIHDISMNGDNHSTADSRLPFSNEQHRFSLTSQDCEQVRQRVFKKNSLQQLAAHNNNNRWNKLSQQHCSNNNNNQSKERPQSQIFEFAAVSGSNNSRPQMAASKSTLKRSVSHSALQSSLNNLQTGDQDGDESDDLNELAKFLYQFKQRQANASKSGSPNSCSDDQMKKMKMEPSVSLATSKNLQQSPSSTTSSSGFASSTCTSNSISSSVSQELIKRKAASSSAINQDPPMRKKYPAPLRPAYASKPLAAVKEVSPAKSLSSGGKLRPSSSLLSIVDEYNNNSTLQSAASRVSSTMDPDRVPVLLGEKQAEANRADTMTAAHNNNYSNCQHSQLEQLKRYTQLRQMSQSELALNHLNTTLNGVVPAGKQNDQQKGGKTKQQRDSVGEQRGKLYKSRLMNLIKRISDKSEVSGRQQQQSIDRQSAALSGSAVGGHNRCLVEKGGRELGQQSNRAINQNESIVSYSNPSKQQLQQKQDVSQNIQHNQQDSYKNSSVDGNCLSESLCDLNFDCDFELIKNCGSTSNEKRHTRETPATTSQQSKTGKSSLSSSCAADANSKPAKAAPSSFGERGRLEGQKGMIMSKAKSKTKHQQQSAASNLSKGESSGNWRLVPTSFALVHPAILGTTGGREQQQPPQQQKRGLLSCKRREQEASQLGEAGHSGKPHADKQSNNNIQPTKLKWSAGGWLMNGSNNGKKKKKQQEATAEGGGSKSCLIAESDGGRLNSGKPMSAVLAADGLNRETTDMKTALIRDGNEPSESAKCLSNVNSEVNQLLDDLDHSLDLVSADYGAFSRKAALLSSWRTKVDGNCDNRHSHYEHDAMKKDKHSAGKMRSSSDSSDEDDDYDYVRINRAMINATFGVDLPHQQEEQKQHSASDSVNLSFQLSIEPGSPTDSFTFSAPNSPAMSAAAAPPTPPAVEVFSNNDNADHQQHGDSKLLVEGENGNSGNRVSARHLMNRQESANRAVKQNNSEPFSAIGAGETPKRNKSNHGNHVIIPSLSAPAKLTSPSEAGSGLRDESRLAANGLNLDSDRIVSSQEEKSQSKKATDEQEEVKDGCERRMAASKQQEIASDPSAINDNRHRSPAAGCNRQSAAGSACLPVMCTRDQAATNTSHQCEHHCCSEMANNELKPVTNSNLDSRCCELDTTSHSLFCSKESSHLAGKTKQMIAARNFNEQQQRSINDIGDGDILTNRKQDITNGKATNSFGLGSKSKCQSNDCANDRCCRAHVCCCCSRLAERGGGGSSEPSSSSIGGRNRAAVESSCQHIRHNRGCQESSTELLSPSSYDSGSLQVDTCERRPVQGQSAAACCSSCYRAAHGGSQPQLTASDESGSGHNNGRHAPEEDKLPKLRANCNCAECSSANIARRSDKLLSRDLHNNGATFCKKTLLLPPQQEPPKTDRNKLIIQRGYYTPGGHFVSPFIAPTDYGRQPASAKPSGADFDDNFILKRKTPNAGLKSRC